jgi:DNA repair ATPase RecN
MASSAMAKGGSCGTSDCSAKMKEVKAKQAQLRGDLNNDIAKVNKEADGKMRQIKQDYNKACKECMKDKEAKIEKFRKSCDEKIKPLKDEENRLRAQMSPGDRMNFANPKVERQQ